MKSTLVFMVSIFVLSSAVLATPGIPQPFYGYVLINGAPAPDGTSVVAKIDGVQVTGTVTTAGRYGYTPNIFYVDDPDNDRSGKIVSFFVNGVDTGITSIYASGIPTSLNLSINIASQPAPAPSGGGGGGGGGGGFVTGAATAKKTNTTNTTNTTDTATIQAITTSSSSCTERWLCTDWSSCSNDVQTRACEDVNKCSTDLSKPMESQPCNILESQNTAASEPGLTGPGVTGFIIANPAATGGLALAAVGIVYFGLRMRAGKKKK
jgi:hypothetical protein